MANTLMSLLVKLGVDSSDLEAGIDKGVGKAQTGAKSISDSFKNVGASMMKVGAGLTAGLTLPIVAAGTGMIKAASDLEESANAVNVVFGDAKSVLEDYGKTVAETAGLSQAEFNQISAVTGAFLKNVGFDAAEAADQTIVLTERAADMASIFNTDVSQALNAIQSGLKGEFNPLEQFGVKLNAAAIEAYALANGMAANKDELTDAVKAQAALAMVMEQTNQFAGDFVNTSDGLANSTKIMKAQFTDAAAALGTQLLPIGLKLVQLLSSLVDKFNALTPAQQKTILIVAGIVAAIGPAITIIGGLISAIGAIIPVVGAVAGVLTFPLIAIIAAVIAVIALLYAAWTNNWGGIQEKFAAFVAWIKPIWDALWGGLVIMFQIVWAQIKTIWEAFSALFQGDFYTFGEKIREAWDRAWTVIKTIAVAAWDFIKTALVNFVKNVIDYFRSINWGEVGKNMIMGIINGALALRQWAINQLVGFARGMVDAFKGFFGIQSPSKLMENLIGKNMALGITVGFEKQMQLAPVSIEGVVPSMPSNMSIPAGVGGGDRTVNINIERIDSQERVNYLAQEISKVLSK